MSTSTVYVVCVVDSLVFAKLYQEHFFKEQQLWPDCREATIFPEHVWKEWSVSAAQLISSLPGCVQPEVSGDINNLVQQW